MMQYTPEEVKNMDKETFIDMLMNNIYEATDMIELGEGAGLLFGNGHHMRQKVCNAAKKIVKEQWNK